MSAARSPLVILRPQPGNAATATRAAAAGWPVVTTPHDVIRPLTATWPDAADFDGVILTSVAAVRAAGAALLPYRAVPLAAVGRVTAAAARDAGLTPDRIGAGGLTDLLAAWPVAQASGARLLWPTGTAHQPLPDALPAHVTILSVYAMDPLPLRPADWPDGAVLLLHSAGAAARVAAEVAPECRGRFDIVAISAAVAEAAGRNWRDMAVAAMPDDGAMLACAEKLWQKRRP